MLTVAAVFIGLIGFIGAVTLLTLMQVRPYSSPAQLLPLAMGGICCVALTASGLYWLTDSQTLRIGILCGGLVIAINIIKIARRRRHVTISVGGEE
ncbi:hypothetical protein DYE20_05220 [[Mycobacterium] chelonae subsp. gwanakae]|nr:hypothetical protein DYE20_05220 [[Mycobacterium] chelonae subsp. gwanakae]